MSIQITECQTKSQFRLFEAIPNRLFAEDPYFVPVFPGTHTKLFDPKSPAQQEGEGAAFIAWQNGQAVGRIAAFMNTRYLEYHGEKVGFFGLFDFEPSLEVAQALLDTAMARLKEWGMEVARGPINTPMGDELGLLIEGFEASPFIMMPYNPPYYVEIYEKLGLRNVKDLGAYYLSTGEKVPERLERVTERLKERSGIRLRNINMKDLHGDLKIIQDLYNKTLDRNYGFIPLRDVDIKFIAADLKPIVEPDMVIIAEKEGIPIAFSLTLPNINEFLWRVRKSSKWVRAARFLWMLFTSRTREARLAVLGVDPKYRHLGLGAMCYAESFRRGSKRFVGGEMSWVEDNNKDMIKGIGLIGGRRYKTYRVYESALAPSH